MSAKSARQFVLEPRHTGRCVNALLTNCVAIATDVTTPCDHYVMAGTANQNSVQPCRGTLPDAFQAAKMDKCLADGK